MYTINAEIKYVDKNFCCGWGCNDFGAIVVTNKTLKGVKEDFLFALSQQILDMKADGELLPDYFESGDYAVFFSLHTSAILRDAERFTTMAAISRVIGINQKQLSHYASSLKERRPAQRQRIIV
jgi:hypothetical protein